MAWIGAAAAIASAAAGAYGASKQGEAAEESNETQRAAIAANSEQAKQNAYIDRINLLGNLAQRERDNNNFERAFAIEQEQRRLTNSLATAGTRDAEGNALTFDPNTGTWVASQTGLAQTNADRRRALQADDYRRALVGRNVDATYDRTRADDAARTASSERALGESLLARYAANQGRTPQQLEAALIEKNVAEATDPLRRGGADAMLVGYRQGNSGSDALMGALARQGQAGTRSAIANARFAAPTEAFNEREMASKSVLGPATTLLSRGNAAPGTALPTFGGDTSGNLLASVARSNPAALATGLNPRSTAYMPLAMRPGDQRGFTPLNSQGGMAAGFAESMNSLVNNKNIQTLLGKLGGTPKDTTVAPAASTFDNPWYDNAYNG